MKGSVPECEVSVPVSCVLQQSRYRGIRRKTPFLLSLSFLLFLFKHILIHPYIHTYIHTLFLPPIPCLLPPDSLIPPSLSHPSSSSFLLHLHHSNDIHLLILGFFPQKARLLLFHSTRDLPHDNSNHKTRNRCCSTNATARDPLHYLLLP